MRILHVDSGREMRGGQRQVLRLHAGLIRAGVDSLLLAPGGSPLLDRARAERLPCDVLRPLRLPVLSRGADLIHAHDAKSHTLGALFSRAPLVVSRRVAFPVGSSAASSWKYSKPAMFLAVSHYVANQLRRASVPPEKIAVIYDGVPLPPEKARGAAILAPQTVDPAKGMLLAEQAAELAGVSVQFSADLERDLPQARALVYLTRSEGLGSGILLAMAHGVTVIASRIGGIPELIQDGETGILVDNRPEAVAGAFRRINPALGAAAREAVKARFTDAHMVSATMSRYLQVLS